MDNSCKVSVIIPCFNHGEFLPEAVASVKKIQRDDIEIVVVDDGSTDEGTRKVIDGLSGEKINVIRQENLGLAAARNAAVKASQGEYILPLDADDRLRSGWMEAAIGILDSQPKVGVIYGDAQCFGTRTDRWRVGPFNSEQLLRWNFIHCSALYRRAVWEQNGGYDGSMPVQGLEDWDFWLGALEHGWEFEYLPEVFFDYRRTESSMIIRTSGFEDQIKEFVAKKHGRLYQKAWLTLLSERQLKENQRQSIKWALRHLSKLLRARLKNRFNQASFI
jgi:glycosyltransferase involved in cell wall biosynthesis